MISRFLFHVLLGASTLMALEIVGRRWVYGQLPTQLPAGLVYGVVVANLAVLTAWLRRAASRRTGRS
jgi:hypothetical protein